MYQRAVQAIGSMVKNPWSRGLLVIASAVAASIVVQQSNPRAVFAGGPPTGMNVVVLNTPLPVTGTVSSTVSGSVSIAGTPNVNVTGTPSVNVVNSSLPVTGSVSINGTPSVNIANGSLTVTPGPSDPASPSFSPTAANNNAVGGGGNCTVSVQGPDSSHRLVIEQISAYGQIQPASSRVIETDILENGTFRLHYFAPSSQTPDGVGNNNWLVSQTTRLYIDPGNSVTLNVQGDVNATGANCALYYTGYLIPTS